MTQQGMQSRPDPEGSVNHSAPDVTQSGVDALYSTAYNQLKRLAAAARRSDPFATVTTTSLVNEAWFKLSSSAGIQFNDERHLKNIVVRAMRQVLVDSARRRRAVKRAGIHIPIDDNIPFPGKPEDRVLAIDAALKRLLQLNERQARMVEARFFGGLEMSEIATLLDVSEATVQRDWRLARAWLALELSGER